MLLRFTRDTLLLFALLCLLAPNASAATRTWNIAGGGAWGTAGNWDTGVPLAGDDVIINVGVAANITGVPTVALNSLTVNGAASLILTAAAAGNTLTLNSASSVSSLLTLANLNLTVANTGSLALSSTLTIPAGRALTINGSLTGTSAVIANSGTVTCPGTISGTGSTTGTAAFSCTGTLDGTWTLGGVASTLTLGGTMAATAIWQFTGTTVTTFNFSSNMTAGASWTFGGTTVATLAFSGTVNTGATWLHNTTSLITALNITGTGNAGTLAFATGANANTLTMNRTAGGEMTLGGPLRINTTLTFTNGIIRTTAANLLSVTGTAAGAVAGTFNANNHVDGPFQRRLATSYTTVSATAFTWPVGKGGQYLGIAILNPKTNAGGTTDILAEAFGANAGGTGGIGFSSLNTNAYWQMQVVGANNMDEVGDMTLNDASLGTANAIGQCATQNGTYYFLGGTPAVSSVAGYVSPGLALGYFVLGTAGANLCGTYTIGTAGEDFRNVAEVSAVLRQSTMTCDCFFELTANYNGNPGSEDLPITFGANTSSGGPWTATIRPASGTGPHTTQSTTAATGFLVTLNGTDNIVFDGRAGGSGSTTADIAWYWVHSNTALTAGGIFTLQNSVNNAELKYLRMQSEGTTTANNGQVFVSTLDNNNITVEYNQFRALAAADRPANGFCSNGTSAVLANDNIIVRNNEFSDFTNSGVLLSATGNGNGWEVRNNSFFATTAAGSAITVISVGISTGITIDGNYLGGTAVSCGGAAYSTTGTYVGIGLAGATTVATVTNNTIQNISTSNSFIGIQATAGSNLIIGSTGAGNTIGHASTASSVTSTFNGVFQGIVVTTGTAGSTVSVSDNTIANLTQNQVGAATQLNGIRLSTTTTVGTTTANNLIYSLTSNGTTVGRTVAGISYEGTSSGTHSCEGNTLHTLSNTTATANVNMYGIYGVPTGGTLTIRRNNIHSLALSTTGATATLVGIACGGPGTGVHNNMIRIGINAAGTALNNNIQMYGIDKSTNNAGTIYHNSVYVGGNVTAAGALNTAALRRTVTAVTTDDIRNNLLVNARTNTAGTGRHYAILMGSTVANASGCTNNYNLYYAPNTGGTLASLDNGTTPLTTLQALRATLLNGTANQDMNSGIGDPSYLNPTGDAASVNLHLNTTTPAEGAGIVIGSITDDVDGETRSGLTPTDIGADALNGTVVDVYTPVITYTRLYSPGFSSSVTTNPTLSATIADVGTGVPTAGANVPRIWYRRTVPAASAWFSQPGTLTSGDGNNGTWDLTIDYADVGGLTANQINTFEYYVVAQDQAGTPNVFYEDFAAATPLHSDVNTQTSAPVGAFTFDILPSFSGTLTVGTGGDFLSLTNAGGLFATLNIGVLAGDLTVNIISDLAAETGTNALNELATSPAASPYRITIQSSTTTQRVISGAHAGTGATAGLVRMNGADRVAFHGGTGTDRYLLIRNTNTTGTAFGFHNDAQDCRLNNMVLEAGPAATTIGVVYFGAANGAGTGNDRDTLTACDIRELTTGPNYPANGIYSAGTAARENSDNVVSGCNVFNFFLANGAATGINIVSNSTAWKIENNDLYQTVSRTATGALPYKGIWVQAGQGYTITGNAIGGTAADCGGTPWTVAGAFANTFSGILLSGSGTTSANTVSNNTIANFNFSTTSTAVAIPGVFCGICQTTVLSTVFSGNTIGATTGTGNITATTTGTGAISFGIAASMATTPATTVQNNNIGSLTLNGSATASHSFSAIIIAGNAGHTISGNVVGSTTTANSIQCPTASAAAIAVSLGGITVNSTGGTTSIANNTIANLSCTGSTTNNAGQLRGITTAGTGAFTIENNLIHTLTSSNANINADANSVLAGIYSAGTNATQIVRGNTVYNLIHTPTTAAAYQITGIMIGGGTSSVTEKNLVQGLSSASTGATASLQGIAALVAGTVQNNYIRLGLLADGSNFSGTALIYGLRDASTANNNIWHNTVLVNGTVASATVIKSAAFIRTAATGSDDVRNNLFVNNRTGGGGGSLHFGLSLNTVATPANFDYNVYVSTAGTHFSTDNATSALAAPALQRLRGAYTTAALQNLHSGIATLAQVNFLNATGNAATLDLRLNNATCASNAGIAIGGVTDDFDGTARQSPPDIGADEGVFDPIAAAQDVFGPLFQYTAIPNSAVCGGGGPTVDVTIADLGAGVPTAGATVPRMYLRRAVGATTTAWSATASVPGVLQSGTGNSGVWRFTVDYTVLGVTEASADEYEYYFVAQDEATSPNVWYSTFNATTPTHPDVNTTGTLQAGTFALGTNRYRLLNGISGTVTVGTGGTYPTFNGAAGLFTAMNNAVLTGHLTVLVRSNITETVNTPLNEIASACGGPWNIYIQPETATLYTISSNQANGLFRFNGTDRVIIDGRFGGSGQYLLLRNTNASGSDVMYLNDARLDTVRYCILESQNQSATSGTIVISTGTTTGNDSIRIESNNFRERTDSWVGYYINSVYSSGTAGVPNDDIAIVNNDIRNFSVFGGVGTQARCINVTGTGNGSRWLIQGNSIYCDFIDGTGAQTAIDFRPGAASVGNQIRDNYIGGDAPLCGGVNGWRNNTQSDMIGLYFSAGNDAANPNIIDGNRIGNMVQQEGEFAGITCVNIAGTSRVIFSNNTIGHPSDLYDVYSSSGGVAFGGDGWVYGIYSTTNAPLTITGNTLGGLSSTGSYYGSCAAMWLSNTTAVYTITNNTIVNSYTGGDEPGSYFYGILITGSQASGHVISGNVLRDNGCVDGFALGAANTYGIVASGTNSGGTISGNTITSLYNANGASLADSPTTFGLFLGGTGNWEINNNVIVCENRLIDGTINVDLAYIQGIADRLSSGSASYLNNTVVVGGSQAGGSINYFSVAYDRWPSGTGVGGANVYFRNNAFINRRTGGTNSSHYVVANEANTPTTGWATTASDYNLLAGSSAATIGYWEGSGDRTFAQLLASSGGDLSSWSTTTGAGALQLNATNLFVDLANDNVAVNTGNQACWYLNGKGVAGPDVSNLATDLNSNARNTTYGFGIDIGAQEFTPNAGITPHAIAYTPTPGGTNTFTFASRTIGSIDWAATGTVPAQILVEYFSGDQPGTTPSPSYSNSAYADFMYRVTPTGGSGYTYTMNMNYDDALRGTYVANESAMMMIKTETTPTWIGLPGSGTNPTTNILTKTGLIEFSFFSAGEINPLPVEELHFTARAAGQDVQLDWRNAREINLATYTIERSFDGRSFTDLEEVTAQGVASYRSMDMEPQWGHNYYRLRMTDHDGSVAYSNTELVVFAQNEKPSLYAYTPTEATLRVEALNVTGPVSIELLDIQGRLLSTWYEVATDKQNRWDYDLSDLSKGIYLVRVRSSNDQITKRIQR